MQKMQKEPLTIEQVKACFTFSEPPFLKTLANLCDCWYKIALQEGKTPEQAARVALDKASEKMINISSQLK